ncbi:hypothetical protein [Alkalicoccus saliphilus]|uniref:hypothetical protein n=1 Tax=Alkalicoccus saliphilus TaxID=200989 RepID=UPI001358A1DB|nr:hypothetical protein [Alkalicoccus saliphilus]
MNVKSVVVRVPMELLKEIENYQNRQGITKRSTAILELIRLGLKQQETVSK